MKNIHKLSRCSDIHQCQAWIHFFRAIHSLTSQGRLHGEVVYFIHLNSKIKRCGPVVLSSVIQEALQETGDLSRVYPTFCLVTAEGGCSPPMILNLDKWLKNWMDAVFLYWIH